MGPYLHPRPTAPDALVVHAPVISPGGQGMVPDLGEVNAEALSEGIDHDGTEKTAELLVNRQLDVFAVEDGNFFSELLGEVQNPVHEGPGFIFTVEHEDAGAFLHQLQGAVEELGGMNSLTMDPLHFLQNAHGVEVGLSPHVAAAHDHVVVGVLVLLRQFTAAVIVLLLGFHQVRSDLPHLIHELAAAGNSPRWCIKRNMKGM